MKFTIQGRLDSLNDYTSANRTNRFKGSQMKNNNEKKIIFAIKQARLQKVERFPVTLKIRWYEKNSRRDCDNIVFATKFIQDALVKAGILIDDSQKYINKLEHEVYVDKANPRIEVEIVEREDL